MTRADEVDTFEDEKTTAVSQEKIMTEHTPGPWTAPNDRGEVYATEKTGNNTARLKTIAKGCSINDARLIAAAPELLQNGNELLDALYRLFPEKLPLEIREQAENLLRSIDKATGASK